MTAGNGVELLPPSADIAQRRYALGPGVVVGSLGVTLASCPVGRMAVRARVTGPIAAVEAVMAFSNPYNEPLELFYLFALPRGASVSKFKAQIGGRLLEGKVFEKEVAQQQYQIPTLPPFLVNLFSREYAPVFCVPLGKCQAGENITIELAYAQFLTVSDVDFQFRFPLTTSPALTAGASLDGRELADASPIVASGLKAGPGLSIAVQLEVGAIVPQRVACSQACQVHKLQNGDISVELSKQNELTARDFIVSYRYGDMRNPQSFLRVGQRHFMLNVIPPWERPQNTLPRDLIILLDISESSDDQRFSVAQTICRTLLESLGPGEQFSLVGFNHNVQGYEVGNPCPPEHVPQALEWLSQIKPSGRADMGELWKRVIRMEPQPGRALTVVLICSGTVGNEPKIYDATAEEGFNFRICSVGLDNQVNGAFLRRLAASSGGKSMIISSHQPANFVAQRLVEATKFPLISRLHWQDHGCAAMMETITPASPANLSNEPITIFGMRAGEGALSVRGISYSGANWEEPVRPVPCLNPAVAFVWASQKVDEMIDELHLLTGPKASKLRNDSLLLCQEYRLLTELSAYVVLEPQAPGPEGRPGGVLLPALTPSDWTTGILDELPSGGERTRLYERRVQLLPPSVEPSATEAESEPPPPVKPGLVRADDSEPQATGGLRPKTPILQQKPKHDKSPKVGKGGKIGDKPVFRKNGEQVTKKPQLPRPGAKAAEATAAAGQVAVVERPPTEAPAPPVVEPTVVAAPVAVPTPTPTPVAAATPVPTPAPVVTAPAAGDLEPKVLLQQHPELRETLMKELRYLFQVVAKANQGQVDPQIPAYLETVLRRVRPMVEQSSGMKEIYRIGVLCYQAIGAKDPQAFVRTQQWVQKFASVF